MLSTLSAVFTLGSTSLAHSLPWRTTVLEPRLVRLEYKNLVNSNQLPHGTKPMCPVVQDLFLEVDVSYQMFRCSSALYTPYDHSLPVADRIILKERF